MPFRQNQKSSLGGNAVTYRILRASMAYSERSNMRAGNWAGQAQYCTTVMHNSNADPNRASLLHPSGTSLCGKSKAKFIPQQWLDGDAHIMPDLHCTSEMVSEKD